MESVVPKLIKTLLSLISTFILFLAIVAIAFYFYLSDGVELKLDKSNTKLSSLTQRFEIDFDESSSVFFKARDNGIDTYITLVEPVIKKSKKILLEAENITLNTSLDFRKTLELAIEIILNNNTDLNLINPVAINLKSPLLDISNFQGQDILDKSDKKFFNVSIKADNGKMIDGKIDLGEFDFLLNIKQFSKNSILDSYKFRLKSSEKFPASYIAKFFPDVDSIGDSKETVSFDITLEDKSFNDPEMSQKLNGVIQIRNTTMTLKRFPVELKPEPIYSLNLDLNIIDNIAQANLTGSLYNPKKRWKYQSSNLQIGGRINFEEILKPNLDLIVNGYDIHFAKLDNPNLNGLADLTVSIVGKNVLDLKGSLKIKESSGFLVPLADTEFQAKHVIRSLNEKK
jgi:hypothetical protein